jgi:hypothetical protein
MASTCRVSTPVFTACRASSVLSSMLAPASSTNDAAICVTAKMRRRRLVLPVIRRLVAVRLKPCDPPDDGRRGAYASSTAAIVARAAPIQRVLESTVRSRAHREGRGVTRQDRDHRAGAARRAPPRPRRAADFPPGAAAGLKHLLQVPRGTRAQGRLSAGSRSAMPDSLRTRTRRRTSRSSRSSRAGAWSSAGRRTTSIRESAFVE